MKTLLSAGIAFLTLYALGVHALSDPEPNPYICPFNEEYRECSCEKTCCNGRDKESCASQCLSGCFCREGLVRDEYGNCIELEDCGKIEPPSKCSEDQQYYRNKPDCKNTCENYDNPAVLCAIGKPGCFCKEKLVLRKDGKCVPPEECPQGKGPGVCGTNEDYLICGSACPDTCGNYGKDRVLCNRQCIPGCFCKPGYVRNRLESCILPELCQKNPRTCNKDERYLTCGSACPSRCGSLAPRPCSFICIRGCYCKDGLVRDTNLKCVRPEKCSNRNDTSGGGGYGPGMVCSENEEYNSCGSNCPPTCDKPKPGICIQSCKAGCFCKPGFIRQSVGGPCIPETQCPAGKGPGVCGTNEQFTFCGSACPDTCDDYGKDRVCTRQCIPGCSCKPGYVRNRRGVCILPELCQKTSRTCNKDEEYITCGSACPITCVLPPRGCSFICIRGCYCKKGLLRDTNLKCVRPAKCKGTGACGVNEQYSICGSACPDTCDNYGKDQVCTLQCKQGCFCKPGYVRNRQRRCVLPEFCEKSPRTCNKDEKYLTCGTACPVTCSSLRFGSDSCAEVCVRGCFCKDGLVRDTNLKCVKPEKCSDRNGTSGGGGYGPEMVCSENEEYNFCGSNCSPTCDKPKPGICKKSCKAGCFCKPGFIRQSKGGPCIPQTQCPAEKCKAGEVYLTCGSACPATCDNYGIPRICTAQCVPGCFCKAGLVRGPNGRCIIPEKCGKENCNEDEEFHGCGTSCPDTCDNYGIDRFCTFQCVRGCFCKRGLVRRNDFKCVIPEKCNKRKCNRDEVFKTCGTPCPKTCDNYQLGIACKAKCVRGCFCAGNTVRNVDNKKCVPREQCPKKKCGKNEEYQACAPYCRPTCDNRNPFCINKACLSGCSCKKNYILSKTGGECIPVSQCPKTEICGENEEYNECGTACPPTCDNRNPRCTKECRRGCYCKKNFIRSKKGGSCIPVKKCRGPICFLPLCKVGCKIVKDDSQPCPRCVCDEPTCKKDEQYYECIPCNNTCETYNKPFACVGAAACKPGCDCREGLVRRKDGKCIRPQQCPKPNCKKDEKYYECIPCNNTCETFYKPVVCAAVCTPGCACREGLFRREDGKCIKPDKCPKPKCGVFEKYTSCVNPCNDCEERGNCAFLVCNKGCDCIKGYHRKRLPNGRCIPGSQCPSGNEKCGRNEEFQRCGPYCRPTCDIRNPICIKSCVSGCFCKKNFILSKTGGECIPVSQCPNTEVCGENEEYKKCGTACPPTCHNRNPICNKKCKKGCFCKRNFIRSKKGGNCIPVKECRKREQCGENEEYSACGDRCQKTCTNPDPPCSLLPCFGGCICKKGFLRNNGVCIPKEDCPKKECGPDEEYYQCKPFCANRCNPPKICPDICVSGCFCKNGLVQREDGKCVAKDQCGSPPDGEECGVYKQYYQCKPKCRNTCETYGKKGGLCSALCEPGCFCRTGLVQRKDGKCVKPNQCYEEDCGPDEEFYQCKPFCKNKCNPPKICPRICIKGCYCRKGLVLREDGKCVKKEECNNQGSCGKNEEFSACNGHCSPRCDNLNPVCTKQCSPGCICKKGFAKDDKGVCVSVKQCPPKCPEIQCAGTCRLDGNHKPCPRCVCNIPTECPLINCLQGCRVDYTHKPCPTCICDNYGPTGYCGKNEVFSACNGHCSAKCDNLNPVCVQTCIPGCICKKGFAKDENGVCIPVKQCPPRSCGKNEVFSGCNGHCSATCDNLNPVCITQCIPGCICKRGFAKDDKGVCIPVKQCPPKCPVIECAGNCRLDANHKPCPRCVCNIPTECPFIYCEQGCHLDYTHKPCPTCVCDNNGPTGSCDKNEVFSACRGHCSSRCDNLDPACTKQCMPGCICKKGFAKDDKGVCIPVKQCPPRSCGKNEEFSGCNGHCSATCDILNPVCIAQCIPGCICKKGFAKNKNGVCIPVKQCPPRSCGKNEKFSECNGHCSARCDNLHPVCSKLCIPGCICQKGFAKDENGVCIPVKQCPQENCGLDEEFYQCKPFCTNRCNPIKICPKICIEGCYCRKGLVLADDGKCVRKEECKNQGIQCSIPKCDMLGCQINYDSKPCPSCECEEGGIQCDPPKCDDPGCELDFSTKPCPSCRCEIDEGGIQCYPKKCDDPGCAFDFSTKPCPTCRCEIDEGGIQCDPPKCDDPGCELDFSTKPCPTCRCQIDEGGIQCYPKKCDGPGCAFDFSTKPCPTCRCEIDEGGIKCDLPKCDDPGCELDFSAKPCPTCRCQIDEGWGNQQAGGEQTDRRRIEIESESESDYYSYSESNEYSYEDSQQVNGESSSGREEESDNEEIITESYESDDQTRLSDYTEYGNGGSEYRESSFSSESSATDKTEDDSGRTEGEAYENTEQTDYEVFEEDFESTSVNEDSYSTSNTENYEERTFEYEESEIGSFYDDTVANDSPDGSRYLVG